MKTITPEMIVINPRALEYEVGHKTKQYFEDLGVPISVSNRVTIEGDNLSVLYKHSKKTVFVTLNKEKKLRQCLGGM